MREYEINIYKEKDTLPPILEGDFFHSLELFQILGQTPGAAPMMVIATHKGKVAGQMLVILYHHRHWVPPYIYTHAHVYGEGLYAQDYDSSAIFPLLLRSVTISLRKRHCFYIEFSRLSKKMIGYRHFRKLGYVPIPWQEIHNSLHSMPPEERLSERQKSLIQKMKQKGVECHLAKSDKEISKYHSLLKRYFRFKIHRHVPDEMFFQLLGRSPYVKTYLLTYNQKLIGGYTCISNQRDTYLWYAAFRRKSYIHLHPDTMTIWHALENANQEHAEHLHFMDAGLPLKSNLYREFILGFGGKPVTKYRWFRFYPRILNKMIQWIYKT